MENSQAFRLLRCRSANPEINCTADASFGNASWTKIASGATQSGTCLTGYATASGAPLRYCNIDGTWSQTVTNACKRTSGVCPRAHRAHLVPCAFCARLTEPPFSPSRPPRVTPLPVITCAATSAYGNATFATATYSTVATGTCNAGYTTSGSAPTLSCSSTGVWGTVSNPCVGACRRRGGTATGGTWRDGSAQGNDICADSTHASAVFHRGRSVPPRTALTCAAITSDASTSWPAGVAGSPSNIVVGTCKSGYYVATGSPYRGCNIAGTFDAITNPCIGAFEPSSPFLPRREALTCVLCACGLVPAAQPSPARRSRRPTATTPPGRPARCPAASLAPAPPATAAR